MADTLTVAEYATATTSLRAAQSELLRADLEATKAALARLRTAQGRVEQKRRANVNASRLYETARMAERMADLARLERESLESKALGRQRLAEATAELYGIPVEQVTRQRDRVQPARGRGRPPGSKNKPKPMPEGVPYGTLDRQKEA